jgi:glycosyltransferase involved in cell wall biosynthesis
MKVLLVAPYFFERHRWNIAAFKTAHSLARVGCEVVAVTGGSAGQPSRETPAPGLTLVRLRDVFLPDPANYGIIPFLWIRILRIVLRERPTHFVVFTHMFHASLAVVPLKLLRRKVVVVIDTFPGFDWFGSSRLVNFVLWLYARTLGMLVLRLADRVALLHEGLEPTARRLRLPYVVHPYGVDMHRYREPGPPANPRKGAGELWIAYVGRLETVKNVGALVRLAERITQAHSHVRFLFVGDVSAQSDLVSRHSSDRVSFLGHRDDVPSLLSETDVFVLASLSEGLPSALMEAMASGCACVATAVGGIPHLFGKAEEGAGLLVPPRDDEALFRAVDSLVRDDRLRQTLGGRAKEVIEKHYQMDHLAKELVSLLEEVSKERGTP